MFRTTIKCFFPVFRLALIVMVFLAACSPARKGTAGKEHPGEPDEYKKSARKEVRDGKGGDDRLGIVVNEWMGTPYKYGGTSLAGVDCSGFVRAVFFEAFGVDLARSTLELLSIVQPISKSRIERGDLLFFEIEKGRDYHVGIYLGHQKFVHASSKRGVMISSLEEQYFAQRFYAAGKVKGQK